MSIDPPFGNESLPLVDAATITAGNEEITRHERAAQNWREFAGVTLLYSAGLGIGSVVAAVEGQPLEPTATTAVLAAICYRAGRDGLRRFREHRQQASNIRFVLGEQAMQNTEISLEQVPLVD
jgi:hypothetical protein